ncbi:MAG TPA: hypothetical protein VN238_02855 [Solirubrobacteraceae bacterium]|nr:hypothetical protein [Solirubrobacteraceae bacterium]
MNIVNVPTDLIERTAATYRERGFDVVRDPEGAVYGWESEFRPDLLARYGDETIVVVVTSRYSLMLSPELRALRVEIDRRPRWRFEMVIVEDQEIFSPEPPRPDRETLREQLASAAAMLETDGTAALLLVAATLEAHLRAAAFAQGVETKSRDLLQLVADGASLGYVEDEDRPAIHAACDTWERLAHGFLIEPDFPSPREAAEILVRATEHVSDELDDGTD